MTEINVNKVAKKMGNNFLMSIVYSLFFSTLFFSINAIFATVLQYVFAYWHNNSPYLKGKSSLMILCRHSRKKYNNNTKLYKESVTRRYSK